MTKRLINGPDLESAEEMEGDGVERGLLTHRVFHAYHTVEGDGGAPWMFPLSPLCYTFNRALDTARAALADGRYFLVGVSCAVICYDPAKPDQLEAYRLDQQTADAERAEWGASPSGVRH